MRKALFVFISFCFLIACGKGKSAKQIAQEICDCSKKANAMDPADPRRYEAQDDCQKKNVEGWNKVKEDIEKAAAFNEVMSGCATEQIRKSFGK